MAAKRLRDIGSDRYSDQPEKSEQKRLKALPSFSTVIRDAMMLKSLQNVAGVLEPLFRKWVREEFEHAITKEQLFQRSLQMQIGEVEPSNLRLVFKKPPSIPIFTGSKIEDSDNNSLQVLLIDAKNGQSSIVINPMPIKIQVVVLGGDFPYEINDNWNSDDFEKNIVRERTGKRPLLTGDLNVTLREGIASIGELRFTDNSSWNRSHRFRLGVRAIREGCNAPRIIEAVTEAFRVRDHRGHSYMKHYPPALNDDVWRLEKIGKDGTYHDRLRAEGINTVHDFLKLWAVDSTKLRTILDMSDRMWEVTVGHARTCPIGEMLYMHRKQNYCVYLNSICEVFAVTINDAVYSFESLNKFQKTCVKEIVQEAYQNWDMLVESDQGGFVQNQIMPQETIEEALLYPLPGTHVDDLDEVENTTGMSSWSHLG